MLVQLSSICFSSSTAATNNSHQLPLKDWDLWRRSKSLRIWEPPDAKPLDERTKLQKVHKKKIHLPHFANGLQQNDKNLWLETVRLKHWLKACRQTQCLGKKIEVPTSCCFVSCAFIWLDVSIIRTCQNGVSHVGVTCDSCSSKLLVTSSFSVENWSTKKMPETKPTFTKHAPSHGSWIFNRFSEVANRCKWFSLICEVFPGHLGLNPKEKFQF